MSGLFSALAGIVLVGYGGQAALGMGDPYLFQSIAAVVIGGASILGGRGNYIGSAAGAISLVTLVSVLMAMNMPEYGRSIIYGVIISRAVVAVRARRRGAVVRQHVIIRRATDRQAADDTSAENQHADHEDSALDHHDPSPEGRQIILHRDDDQSADDGPKIVPIPPSRTISTTSPETLVPTSESVCMPMTMALIPPRYRQGSRRG